MVDIKTNLLHLMFLKLSIKLFILLKSSYGFLFANHFNDDIAAMSELESRRELERARIRLLFDPKPDPWLVQRIDALTKRATNAN